MKQNSENNSRVSFPIQFGQKFNGRQAPDKIHILPYGTFERWEYSEPVIIDDRAMDDFVDNFNNKVRKSVPITAGHDSFQETPAVGWFTKVWKDVKGLWGEVEWTEYGLSLLSKKLFDHFSAEYFPIWKDEENNIVLRNVLSGGALTNNPFFKNLENNLAFSETGGKDIFAVKNDEVLYQFNDNNDNDMTIEEIVAKDAASRTVEEKAFLVEHKEELTEEQKTAVADVLGEEEAKEVVTDEIVVPAEEETPAETVAASEKSVTMSFAEATALRTMAKEGAQAFKKIEASERAALVASLTFSTNNPEGKFTPAANSKLDSFVVSLSEAQRKNFTELMKLAVKADTAMFSELGDDGGEADSSAVARVDVAVKKEMSESKSSYGKALTKVFSANPALAKSYEEELSATE